MRFFGKTATRGNIFWKFENWIPTNFFNLLRKLLSNIYVSSFKTVGEVGKSIILSNQRLKVRPPIRIACKPKTLKGPILLNIKNFVTL